MGNFRQDCRMGRIHRRGEPGLRESLDFKNASDGGYRHDHGIYDTRCKFVFCGGAPGMGMICYFIPIWGNFDARR